MPNIMTLVNIDDQYVFPFERPLVPIIPSVDSKHDLWSKCFATVNHLCFSERDHIQVFVEIAKHVIVTCLHNGYDSLWVAYDDPTPSSPARATAPESVIRDLGKCLHDFNLQTSCEGAALFAILHLCHTNIAYLGSKLSVELAK